MNQDAMMGVIGAIGALVLVGSGLLGRRLPRRQWLRLALVWAAIILLAWAATIVGSRIS